MLSVRRLSVLPPVIDAFCIAVFVVIGRQSHGLDGGAGWFLTVVWPFAAGWFIAAVSVRLYTSASRPWLRLTAVSVLGIALGLLLRVALTHRDAPVSFVIVAYAFITPLVFGWRRAGQSLAQLVRRT